MNSGLAVLERLTVYCV